MAWSKAEIVAICENCTGETVIRGVPVKNSMIIFKMLQSLYLHGQTPEEKDMLATKEDNGIGFNGVDAFILSDIAEKSAQYMKKNPGNKYGLGPGQTTLVARKLKKYAGQLARIAARKASAPVDLIAAQTNAQTKLPITVEPPPAAVKRNSVTYLIEDLRQNDPEQFCMDGELTVEQAVRHWTRVFSSRTNVHDDVYWSNRAAELEAEQEMAAMYAAV